MKQQRRKHIPKRTCVACRQKMDKRLLTRIVHTADEGVIVDMTGKRNGRGAYLCQNPECWDMALQSNLLDRALKTEISKDEKKALVAFRLDATPSLDS